MKTAVISTLIIALVCAGFLAGYFLSLQSSTVSDLPENIAITNVELSKDDSEYWITITVNNTGISDVSVVKLLFNNVKQSSVSPSLPISLAPDAGAIINAAIDVTEEEYQTDTLNIDVITSKGNTFSKVFTQSLTIGFMSTEQVVFASVTFDTTSNTVQVTLKNSGTSQVTISNIYLNGVGIATTSVNNPDDIPFTIDANDNQVLNFTAAITAGGNYQIKVVTSKGNPFIYTTVAPS